MNTKRLTAQDVAQAAAIISSGGLLGIPTETVYGLGANGLNERTVAAIFAAKGRPQDNPLILHIPDVTWLERYCVDIPPVAYGLAARFWPGPLTMVLKRKPNVPDAVTAGLSTVGMRCPACAVTRAVIAAAGVPIAAPSGNTSGRPSPTSAEAMLEDMDGKIDAILDDGPCEVGVESTILDLSSLPKTPKNAPLTNSDGFGTDPDGFRNAPAPSLTDPDGFWTNSDEFGSLPRLLRPGGITLEQLESVLGPVAVDEAVIKLMSTDEQPRAPGMKYRHYAPKAPVTVVNGDPSKTAQYIVTHLESGDGVICFDNYVNLFLGFSTETLGPEGDQKVQAQRVFEALRAFDRKKVTRIWAQSPRDTGLGLAVTNRLNKAAGFHIIQVE